MLIVSYTTKNPDKRAYLVQGVRKIIPTAEIRFIESDNEVRSALRSAEIFLTYRFHKEWWAGDKILKWVHIGGAGVNHILFPQLVASSVVVTNCKGMHGRYMAEYVLGVMLYFSQRLRYAEEWQEHRDWFKAKGPMTRQTFLLNGKWVLIVGAGAIGSAVGELCHNLGMKLLAITRTAKKNFPWSTDSGDHTVLDYFIPQADFVVITLPLTEETKGLFDAQRIGMMKSSAVLINISRGGIIAEEALISALNNGKIAGACLDCYQDEPLPGDSPLFGIRNLLITPHIAGNFPEYTMQMIDIFLDNLKRYVNGEELKNVIDFTRGY